MRVVTWNSAAEEHRQERLTPCRQLGLDLGQALGATSVGMMSSDPHLGVFESLVVFIARLHRLLRVHGQGSQRPRSFCRDHLQGSYHGHIVFGRCLLSVRRVGQALCFSYISCAMLRGLGLKPSASWLRSARGQSYSPAPLGAGLGFSVTVAAARAASDGPASFRSTRLAQLRRRRFFFHLVSTTCLRITRLGTKWP